MGSTCHVSVGEAGIELIDGGGPRRGPQVRRRQTKSFERYFSRTTVPVVHDAPGVTETRVWFELRALYSSESEVSV